MIGTQWVINKRGALSLPTSKLCMSNRLNDASWPDSLGPGGWGAGLDSVFIVAPYGSLGFPKFL